MINSYFTSVLKEMPLISSHLFKYLSGDCLILQASEPSPSMPRPRSLEVSLYLSLWHQTQLSHPPAPYKKKQFECYHIKGKMPLSVNCLRSVRINQLWDRIHLRYRFFQTRGPSPPISSQKCKYIIYNIYILCVWWKDTSKVITSGWSKTLPAKEWFPLCGSDQSLMLYRCAPRPDCKSYKHCHNIVRLL